MKKILPYIIVVLLLFVVGYFVYTRSKVEYYSYVILKINPEVELGVDAGEVVREVNALNDDAELLLSDMNLLGKPLEKATEDIIDSTVEIGKLENQVELTVMNRNEEKRLALETKIKTKIEAHIENKNYNALLTVKGLTEEIKTSADSYEISYGKMLLISKAVELNPELKVEELVEKSIKDIQGYIKEVREEKRNEMLEEKNITIEELKEEFKQRKAELKGQNSTNNNSDNDEDNTDNNGTETQNRIQNGR